jgi:hypothetical protein
MMHRVSSNITLLLKLFLPTFWATFFGLLTAFTWLYNASDMLLLTNPVFRIGITAFYITFLLIIYFTLVPLKRVELGSEYYHVSNYIKQYRFVYEDIQKVNILHLGRFSLIEFRLKGKSSFGFRIRFLANRYLWDQFMGSHPSNADFIKKLQKN